MEGGNTDEYDGSSYEANGEAVADRVASLSPGHAHLHSHDNVSVHKHRHQHNRGGGGGQAGPADGGGGKDGGAQGGGRHRHGHDYVNWGKGVVVTEEGADQAEEDLEDRVLEMARGLKETTLVSGVQFQESTAANPTVSERPNSTLEFDYRKESTRRPKRQPGGKNRVLKRNSIRNRQGRKPFYR